VGRESKIVLLLSVLLLLYFYVSPRGSIQGRFSESQQPLVPSESAGPSILLCWSCGGWPYTNAPWPSEEKRTHPPHFWKGPFSRLRLFSSLNLAEDVRKTKVHAFSINDELTFNLPLLILKIPVNENAEST